MRIRPQHHDDPAETAAVAAAIVTAFADDGAHVATLWADVERQGLVRASLVAEVDGEVVGHLGLSHAWLDARRALVDVLVLSPVSVLPAHQRAGIGAALLEASVAESARLGAPMVVLEGDPGYYGSRGFVPASDHGVEAPSRRIPGPAFQLALLPAHEEWMTGRVVYREVWWAHDATGLRDPLLAAIEGPHVDSSPHS